jgi:hypothetical protein
LKLETSSRLNLQVAITGSITRIKGTAKFINSKLLTLEVEALGKFATVSGQVGGPEKKEREER